MSSTGACLRNDFAEEAATEAIEKESILIVDSNPVFREMLAQELGAANYNVVMVDAGERAFRILRHRQHTIGWLYSRVALPGLVDGWILADEYHGVHPDRPAIVAAQNARSSARGDIVLAEPTLTTVLEVIWKVIAEAQPARARSL